MKIDEGFEVQLNVLFSEWLFSLSQNKEHPVYWEYISTIGD